ncbi:MULTISPECIES: oxygenase MpaB family protein [Mumia]|uniref:Oxygenase MpaB family protein n=1 Tax=Mumia xiangluensis TaxID=1678900 RepID=A0ABW1QLK4_9ACTN|nr:MULTISPECIES: oxygenase MpaB family protein [Mumia]
MTLGAALGLASVVTPSAAWSWSPSGSIAGAGTGVDPQWVWDDEIDQIMASALDNGQVPAINDAILPWVNNGQAVPSGLPPELAAFLQREKQLPAWADMAKLRRAANFNRKKDMYLFFLYGLGGGIMSTVIPREAKSVYWSAGGADMQDRAAKTFSFGYDLSDINAFETSGQFLVTSNKTRLVHAAVRHLLPQSPHWKAVADETIPISNADILVTFHSTGTFAHKKMKEWGIPMLSADQDAFLHSWQVALHMLGVRDEYIPSSWNAAHAQSAQVLTPILGLTPEGKALAEVLLGLISQVDLGVTRGFLNEFVRYQLGNEIGDWLELKRDYVSAGLIRVGWPAYIAFREGLLPLVPANFYLFDQLIKAIAMAFLNRGESGLTTPITIPTGNRAG